MGSAERGEQYYRSGRVLWVVKSGSRLYGKVLGTYPYSVTVDLKGGKSTCTCPLGGNCKHVHAVMKAYESGFYFEDPSPLLEVNAEAVAWSLLLEVPELALEVSLKELMNSLGRDESGSETAVHLLRALKLVEITGKFEFLHPIEAAFEEFRAVFGDYPLTSVLEEHLNALRGQSKKAL